MKVVVLTVILYSPFGGMSATTYELDKGLTVEDCEQMGKAFIEHASDIAKDEASGYMCKEVSLVLPGKQI